MSSDTRSNSIRSTSIKEVTSNSEYDESASIPSFDEEDSEFIRAMTPSKRRRPTFPESPFIEPGCPVAESTATVNAFGTIRRSRKKLTMPSSVATPEIQMQRSSRTASYVASMRQVQPQAAAMSRRRSSSSQASSESEMLYVGESEHFINWGDGTDDEENILMDVDKIFFKPKGKDYDEFKPVNKDGMFYQIVFNYHETRIHVQKWTDSYKKDSELASICEILQLFVDMMGMQDVNVQNIYKKLEMKPFNSKVHPIIEHISKLEIKGTTQRYLLACSTQWSKGVRNVFHAFFDAFITQCFAENILYTVTNQLIYFLMQAIESKFRAPLVHTSAFIIIIMTNAFVDLIVSIKYRYGDDYTNKTLQWMLEMTIYMMHKITNSSIVANSLKDKRLNVVRIDVLQFMNCWIKTYPSLFLSEDKTYDLIKLLLIDEHLKMSTLYGFDFKCIRNNLFQRKYFLKDLVRLEALSCCMKIISADKQHVHFDNFKTLLFIVIQRIQDCNIAVASKAVQCHTKAIERFPELISHKLNIPSRNAALAMLSKHFILRKQALLNLCVSIKLLHISPSDFLTRIAATVHILNKTEKHTFMLFLIESAYQLVPELSKLELILEVIYSELEQDEYAYYLLIIFCNSVKMQYHGYLADIGEHSREDLIIPDLREKRSIAKILLDNLERLLSQFDEYNIVCILETLNCVSINDFETPENTEVIRDLPQLLIKCFEKYAFGEILDEITIFFSNCLKAGEFTKNHFESNVEDLCKFVTNFPTSFIYNVSADNKVETFTEITLKNELCLEKLNSLIKNINFIEHSKLDWDDIYVDWSNPKKFCTIKITTLQMECCQHYLTWYFKQITSNAFDDTSINMEIKNLNTNIKQYIDTLVSILMSKVAKTSLQNTAFECLSDLHLDLKHVINAVPLEQYEGYKKISPENFSEDICSLLCTFVADKIGIVLKVKSSNAKDLDLERSRCYVNFILRMLRCGIISLKHCPNILRYFNDELFDAYGDLFIKFLDNVVKDTEGTGCEALEHLMYQTVREVYVSTTYKSTLPTIINQFSQYLRKRRASCPEFFALLIRYVAVKQQDSTEMLTLMEPLLDRITIDELPIVKQNFDKVGFRNKNDVNVNKFRLKLHSFMTKN